MLVEDFGSCTQKVMIKHWHISLTFNDLPEEDPETFTGRGLSLVADADHSLAELANCTCCCISVETSPSDFPANTDVQRAGQIRAHGYSVSSATLLW